MQQPTLKEAVKFWFKLGFISFGGPAGQIAIMHEFLVVKKRWISESKFLHALNYCMLLPGPEAQQLASYIGWKLHGTKGALIAGILFVLPSMFILMILSAIYVTFGQLPWIYALFNGLKPAIIAIIVLALIKISKKSLIRPFHVFIAVASFFCIFFLNISFPVIIIGTIVLASVLRLISPRILVSKENISTKTESNESGYYINSLSNDPKVGFFPKKIVKQITVGVLLWVLPLIAFYYFTNDFQFWKSLALFFTKVAFVTFGGAYAVLPYVAEVSVEQFHWLSNSQMIDGLALGETTPGPLVMVLTFVGFMAGHNHYKASLLMGSIGLISTTFYTFLPCFLFILIGAPLIEKTQGNQKVKEILSLVTAAVVGVILNLTIYLGQVVIFPKNISFEGLDYISLIWIFISFIAMYRFKINMILWILISALFGLVVYWLKM